MYKRQAVITLQKLNKAMIQQTDIMAENNVQQERREKEEQVRAKMMKRNNRKLIMKQERTNVTIK